MKVSLITVCYNSEKTLQRTIQSVLEQDYPHIEYIIVDGGSTDGTKEIIKRYEDQIDDWVSEPDQGIYDAMNKGIQKATGDIIGIINSDDFYPHEEVISQVVLAFQSNKTDVIYGDLLYVDSSDQNSIKRVWNSGEYSNKKLHQGWHPPHPTLFVRKEIYESYGTFDLNYKIAADYEFMLRLLLNQEIRIFYVPKVFVHMSEGGVSNQNLKNIMKANLECRQAWKKQGISKSLFFVLRKPFGKIKQLFKRTL
jgi:glycosyltransferase involved in cell wall biosynthesis